MNPLSLSVSIFFSARSLDALSLDLATATYFHILLRRQVKISWSKYFEHQILFLRHHECDQRRTVISTSSVCDSVILVE